MPRDRGARATGGAGRAPDLGEYYTPEEIAESLRVTRRTVYDWLKSGRLPGLRVGRSWRINREALLAFLRPPIPSILAAADRAATGATARV